MCYANETQRRRKMSDKQSGNRGSQKPQTDYSQRGGRSGPAVPKPPAPRK